VSIHHCAALAFVLGKAGLAEFEDATVHRPDIVAFRARCKAVLDTASPRGAATATVRTTDGRTLSATVLHAKGSLEQPLTDGEIEAKLRDSARHGGFAGPVDAIVAAVWGIDRTSEIGPMMAMLRG
jgi:2-methylcitrate dehydratase PrpD